MIFDTDILVWVERGNEKAIQSIYDAAKPAISVITYMELLQGARSHADTKRIKDFVAEVGFQVFPLTENVGHRALIYIEEYSHSFGLRAEDAIIAATAVENGFMLVSGNRKHFKRIRELKFKPFKIA